MIITYCSNKRKNKFVLKKLLTEQKVSDIT
nr:MAG TPA: hypothetical protein [Caudoviricetes sp.]